MGVYVVRVSRRRLGLRVHASPNNYVSGPFASTDDAALDLTARNAREESRMTAIGTVIMFAVLLFLAHTWPEEREAPPPPEFYFAP
jgi:hypothetical protein